MTTYLKVLGPDKRACHGGEFDYTDYLPNGDAPGPWLPERTPVLCESGWHWCTPESLMRHWAKGHMRVYEAEPSGDVTEPMSDGKCVSRSGRLLREYPLPQWWTDAMTFVRDELPATPWMQRVGPVDPSWRVFPTRDVAWHAARDVAWHAARDAAWAAAWHAARDVAWHAARVAARDVAWVAAWVAAWHAAQDAARDAESYVYIHYLCADLPLDQEHREHAAARWEVWRRGYGLLGDLDGVLYVYEGVR